MKNEENAWQMLVLPLIMSMPCDPYKYLATGESGVDFDGRGWTRLVTGKDARFRSRFVLIAFPMGSAMPKIHTLIYVAFHVLYSTGFPFLYIFPACHWSSFLPQRGQLKDQGLPLSIITRAS